VPPEPATGLRFQQIAVYMEPPTCDCCYGAFYVFLMGETTKFSVGAPVGISVQEAPLRPTRRPRLTCVSENNPQNKKHLGSMWRAKLVHLTWVEAGHRSAVEKRYSPRAELHKSWKLRVERLIVAWTMKSRLTNLSGGQTEGFRRHG
jgi:hypothetical protein